ncbi:MAG: acyltransferase [Eubacteriales bacterium]|nr:acyltransferase [Eubacteriales bacterium]
MLQEIYYKLSALLYKRKLNTGKSPQIRLGATVINGKYITFGDNVIMGKDLVMAVYPEHCGKVNPVKTKKDGGIKVGDHVSGNRRITIYCADSVKIGNDVLLGSDILITDNNHGMNPEAGEYIDQPLTTAPTEIGDGCWIGEQVCILAGSKIGEKCVIAAGSVVTGEIPPYSIAAGAPAKVIKRWNSEKKAWEKC